MEKKNWLCSTKCFFNSRYNFKNITFSQKNLENSFEDENKISDLINLVKLDEFIENLKEKEKTILNEQSVNISGGQAQRIGIT